MFRVLHRPAGPTREAAGRLRRLLGGRGIAKVCGWDYVADYGAWKERFDEPIGESWSAARAA